MAGPKLPGFHGRRMRLRQAAADCTAIAPDTLVALWGILLEQALVDALLKPPVVSRGPDGSIRIDALGTFRYVFDGTRQRVYGVRRGSAGTWLAAQPFNVYLRVPLQGRRWIADWINAHTWPLGEALSGAGALPVEPVDPYVVTAALAETLWQKLDRHPALACQRRWLRAAMPLDPQVARLAMRRAELASGSYTAAWQHLHRERRLRAENRSLYVTLQMLATLQAFALPAKPDPRTGLKPRHPPRRDRDFGHLAQRLRGAGLGRAGWNALYRHGKAMLQPFLRERVFRGEPVPVLAAYANLVAALGSRLPPAALARTVVAAEAIRETQASGRVIPAPLVRAAWRYLERLPDQQRPAFLEQELPNVLHWWYVTGQDTASIPRHAGWGWYRKRCNGWLSPEELAELEAIRWPHPTLPEEFEGLRFVPLDTAKALVLEGRAMRHCLGQPSHIQQFRQGGWLAWSIQDLDGARLATLVAGQRRRLWWPSGIKAFANGHPPADVQWVAARFTGLLGNAHTGVRTSNTPPTVRHQGPRSVASFPSRSRHGSNRR